MLERTSKQNYKPIKVVELSVFKTVCQISIIFDDLLFVIFSSMKYTVVDHSVAK